MIESTFDDIGVQTAWHGAPLARRSQAAVEPEAVPPPSREIIVGLDLGQAQDPTAMAVSEVSGTHAEPRHYLRELGRAPLNTPYPEIVETTCGRVRQLQSMGFAVVLVVDATGPGRPVVDMFDEAVSCPLVALTITGGDTHAIEETGRGRFTARVPKNELIGATVLALEHGRIRIDEDHPEAETFRQELRNVELNVSRAGRETFTHRSGTHDDLVLAAACSVWWAQYRPGPPPPEWVGLPVGSDVPSWRRNVPNHRRR